MEAPMTYRDCPAWLDDIGADRCRLPALVRSRYTREWTDGPPGYVMIRWPIGHWFHGPIALLALEARSHLATARSGDGAEEVQ